MVQSRVTVGGTVSVEVDDEQRHPRRGRLETGFKVSIQFHGSTDI